MTSSSQPPSTTEHTQQTFARALEPLLGGQLRRLRRRYLWHGAGFALLLPTAAIALFFVLDHTLRLPVTIRLLHTLAVIALLTYAIGRADSPRSTSRRPSNAPSPNCTSDWYRRCSSSAARTANCATSRRR